MLCMHVVIADCLLSDFLCRVKLAGCAPTIICTREFGESDSYVVIGLAPISEIAARTLVAWLRTDSGAKSVALNQHQEAARAGNEQLDLNRETCDGLAWRGSERRGQREISSNSL
jgi:hypothetical protein